VEEAGTPSEGRSGRADRIALVVAGYDCSGEAAEAVRWAASLARRTGSALRVVWAWKVRDVWDTAVAAKDHPASPTLVEMEAVARARLTEVVEHLLGGDVAHVDLRLDQGPDAADILLHAAADADVIVVGSRGRGQARSAVLGSVSARCVREAHCPVLVIPHRMADPAAAHLDASGAAAPQALQAPCPTPTAVTGPASSAPDSPPTTTTEQGAWTTTP